MPLQRARRVPFAIAGLVLASAAFVLAGAGCGSESNPAGDTPRPSVDAEARSRLIGARDALLETLSGRLVEAMAEGPDAAIAVCAEEALPLTEDIASIHGVRIGRTSDRLRNPANTPPAWAAELLAQMPETDTFRAAPDGSARAFLPIRLADRCVLCHGPREAIPPAIAEALAARYPEDAATGFTPGEIRGYVWVEDLSRPSP